MSTGRYWFCVIGPIPANKLITGADFEPRQAARMAIENMTGWETHRCTASGWVNEDEAEAMRKARVQCALEANKE